MGKDSYRPDPLFLQLMEATKNIGKNLGHNRLRTSPKPVTPPQAQLEVRMSLFGLGLWTPRR